MDAKQAKEFKRDLEEINRLRQSIGKNPLDLIASDSNLEALPGLLRDVKEAAYELEDSVEGIRGRWEGIVGEIQKANLNVRETTKSFNKFRDVAQKIQYHQRGSNELNSKELKSLVTRQKIEQENLRYQQAALTIKQKSGTATKEELETLNEVNAQLAKETGLVDATLKKTQELYKQQKNIEKATGLTGVALKGIANFTNKIGLGDMGNVFEDAAEAAKATASRLTDGGKKAGGLLTKVRAMGSAFKVVGKAIVENLTDPLVLAGLLIKGLKAAYNFVASAFKKGKEAAMVISEENVNLARSLGLSQKAANKLASSVAGMGPTTAATKQSIESIYSAMGSTEKLSNNTLRVFVKLNTQAGMSAESLAQFQKFAKLSGQDAGVLVKNMAQTALETIKTNKYAFSQRNLLDDVAKVSSVISLRFKDQPAALVKAVAKAKSLGMEMGKIEDIASSLLNFEDSIAAEMEAELLTGKQLNLEKAREAALRGDTAALQDEIIAQLGSIDEFNQMNVLQQDAFAKSIGLSRGELAGMLDAQEKNKNKGEDLTSTQQDGLDAMTSAVSAREREENRARRAAEANISVYKELQPLVDKLRDTWTEIQTIITETLSDQVLKPIVEFLQSEDGKKFLEELPGRVQKFTDSLIEGITAITNFIKAHPKISMGLLGGAVVAKPLMSAAGSLMSGDLKGAALDAAGVERGSTKANPLYTQDINGGGSMDVSDLIGTAGKASIIKQLTTFFSKPQVYFRALAMKGKGLPQLIGRLATKFKGLGSKISGLASKFKGFGSKVGNFVKNMGGGAKNLASKAISGAKGLAGRVASGAKGMMGGAKGMLGKAASGAKGMLGSAKGVAGSALSGIKNTAQSVVKPGNVKSFFKNNIKGLLPKVLRTGKGALGGVMKKIPVLGSLITAIMAGMDINEIAKSQNKSPAEMYSQMGKTAIGSGLGAIFGTVAASLVSSLQAVGIPGWLLATVAFAGGDWLGKQLGNAISDHIGGPALGKGIYNAFYAGKGADSAEDFILQDGKMTKFRKDDLVIGGTKLDQALNGDKGPAGGGSSHNTQMMALLERLIVAVERGGTVTLDGQKVGEALVMSSYKM